jgi:hypothetical protein
MIVLSQTSLPGICLRDEFLLAVHEIEETLSAIGFSSQSSSG